MAEEAIGLAKSLNWAVEWGPNYMIPIKTVQDEGRYNENALENNENSPENLQSSSDKDTEVKDLNANNINKEDKNILPEMTELNESKDDEILEEDKNIEEDESIEGDEWTNIILRQNIAVSSMLKIRHQGSSVFFGSGRVNN